MIRIGITGHRNLAPEVSDHVAGLVREHLEPHGHAMVGLSCLADGADSVFAEVVLEAGAPLEAVIPASGYREALPVEHHTLYDRLLAQAVLVHELPHTASEPRAHMAAGRLLVERSDRILAVWDGLPARGPGGTADVVAYARVLERPVTVLWPQGVRR
ncbi:MULTISPECIES: DNA-processing protein DprA [Nocardiopsis]|uniref:Smf/DprA SLOG domain-containing protein n=2 Tax=Nocardiopsis alba TaxID=53437 RepID=A0A7K2IXZ9_9ACTN|nr:MULTISPECIES: DNA-processing protein DprA [Nocardiopsis]AFR07065.1 DNA recombination-mediator A family protein [Nocardiopsis alba ATCC BAA-2165]MEC3891921.1 DNA-processing protein DprA [Nocardiopsis sp. LDBS1602]MYR34726.1 hypothetical protein [Nocardiopsis alba]